MSFQNPPEIILLPSINGIAVTVLRLDLIHPIAGGNKIYKLKYNLEKAKQSGLRTIVTMGGAFSNHIAATAHAGREAGFKTIGILRGDEILPLNKTLQTARDNGMELHFVDRSLYRSYREDFELVQQSFTTAYCIPEGGSNELAVLGCREILENITEDFDVVISAVGTGTTLAGLTLALKPHQYALGICVLKGPSKIEDKVIKWIKKENGNTDQFTINFDYHFGGYAHKNNDLNAFVEDFNENQPFKIEPVYTGRMFYALIDLRRHNFFPPGTRILAVHTGGLQYLQN